MDMYTEARTLPDETGAAIDPSLIAELAQFTTPSVLNGLKRLGRRPEQLEVLDRRAVQCMSPSLGVRVGFAVTRKDESMTEGDAAGIERNPALTAKLHEQILSMPGPRILVVEQTGNPEGPACIWGEVMAYVNTALGCTAGITNGPVRDLPEMKGAGFQTFASGLAVGGGFLRTLEVGSPVSVGDVTVHPGDLLHGDMHGVLKVPLELVPLLPDAIRAVEAFEQRVIGVCKSDDFTVERLAAAWTDGRH